MTNPKNTYRIIGLMSGTSLDGLDIACCDFHIEANGLWAYRITEAATFPYPEAWHKRLRTVENGSALAFAQTDRDLGAFFADLLGRFFETASIPKESVDFVASHGHTVFHQPGKGFTSQIGCGATLSALSGLPVINDFRRMDVALGGQGAPLVPVADELLFGGFDACLNIGGIANLSFREGGKRIAYDICPANMALNDLAACLSLPYDEDGALAQGGNLLPFLLERLEGLPFYAQKPPKSLGKEWYLENIDPLIHQDPITDLLRTFTEHAALRIADALKQAAGGKTGGKVLCTGGGAYNRFLIEMTQSLCPDLRLVVPDGRLLEFKEALAFAFLGLLRARGENNCLASVTGASRDSCGGQLWGM